ncbi:plexin A4 [Trichuris trichiura]|uniref:Plexin A4 n=1 Tax=Trichuris trichiura TaxID=36087 RepID=A0A077ZB36_TRITR|nr:plexin A4 [Trichuris trichiura]
MTACGTDEIQRIFTNPTDYPLQRLVVERLYTGRVYVAGVNRVYQLSPDLRLESQANTAPTPDSQVCTVRQGGLCVNQKLPDSQNRALVIYHKKTKLIVCDNLPASCRMHDLYNVSVAEERIGEPIFRWDSTTSVAFVADGPLGKEAFYAATSGGGEEKEIAAVGTYSLDENNLMRKVHRTVTTETGVHFQDSPPDIAYIYGFSSTNFSYFISRAPRASDRQSLYHSKVIRVSQHDRNYYTYSELALECKAGGNSHQYTLATAAYLGKAGFDLARNFSIRTEDDVLYVLFSPNVEGERNQPGQRSVLCVYSLPSINQRFLENIKVCNEGEGERGLGHFKPGKRCLATLSAFLPQNIPLKKVIEFGTEINYPFDGSTPIEQDAALVEEDVQLTAVATTTTHMYTVAFLGTHDGRLKKAVVQSANSAVVYETVLIDPGRSVLPFVQFDKTNMFVYAMTERVVGDMFTARIVAKMRVEQCHRYERCQQCLNALDPYCGWCSLESRCSVQESCKSHWLPYKDSKCTSIAKADPDKIQISTTKYLKLTVLNLPAVTGQLSCVFTIGSKRHITGASSPSNGLVSCTTPQTDLLQPLPAGEHAITSILSIQVDNSADFAATNFTFYDCSTFKTCQQCVTSQFDCDWCPESSQCTANSEEDCRGPYVIDSLNSAGLSPRKGPSFCPHIIARDKPVIHVPSGFAYAVTVRVVNLLDFQTDFACEFEIGSSRHKLRARRDGDLIHCDRMEFSYFDHLPNVTAKLSVTWSPGKALDNTQDVRVVIYKCERLASNCGLCLDLPPHFECGWCMNKQSCTINSACRENAFRWLHKKDICPNPKISKFFPTSGPVEGGTYVTIEGINLGRDFSEIETAVRINNVVCSPVAKLYVTSSRIVCVTGPANHRKAHSGPVVVKIKDVMDYVAISDQSFHYVIPEIKEFQPSSGPQSGGTTLTILGEHLNAGSNISVSVGGVPCTVITKLIDMIRCRTGPSSVAGRAGGIEIRFDNAEKTFAKSQFTYEEDPIVKSVSSEKSIVSGGLLIRVHGDRFNLVQDMKMYFRHAGQETKGLCTIESTDLAKCYTPEVQLQPGDPFYPLAERPLLVEYGFFMNDVPFARNISTHGGFRPFSIFPDPEFDFFQPSGSETYPIKYFKNDYLTINGNNIDLALREKDIRVFVGSELCNVTALANRVVTCRPPENQPLPSPSGIVGTRTASLNSLPEVIVSLGAGNRNYTIGFLSYDSPTVFGSLSLETIAIIASVLVAFAAIIVFLLLVYRRKSTKQQRQMKSLKEQIDAIELKVANECKEAFAELQTDITEWTTETTATGIPFLPYKDYVLQVLFPSVTSHGVFRGELDLSRQPSFEKGLRLLNQLFMSKTFLLTFVRVLESNKYFLSKDRVAVGSLLMVILHERMDYCTDILKTLLASLIEKTVERRYQPRILFRRSESIAERMLAAWFTFLMYKYLLECAGQPLFMLYWAIKQQVEKGPQDALLYDARYSLSEEKLIRQTIEFHPLVVYVTSGFDSDSEVAVRVLDCDTISQVKEKCLDAIYRTTPCSRRPSATDLDLEWRTGVSGRLTLQDMDVTTKPDAGWKKINTLAHYKVPNNASLALVPKQSSMYNLSLLSERSDKSSTFSLKNSPTLNRAFSPSASAHSKDSDTGCKVYHLVKPHDQHDIGAERGGGKMGTLQKFVEDLFEAIFSITHRGSALPLCIKYMYDFMDDQALLHGINDPEVVHAWKSNSLPLRFWVNLIKNPHFVFDIPRPTKIEGCLSVVAQTLMDSCSTQDPQLTKDSPSSKLLFARDIHFYREWVERYYADVQQLPIISDQDMNAFLVEESRQHLSELDIMGALNELYKYVDQYKDQLAAALEEDEFSKRNRLPAKLAQVQKLMEGDCRGSAPPGGSSTAYQSSTCIAAPVRIANPLYFGDQSFPGNSNATFA